MKKYGFRFLLLMGVFLLALSGCSSSDSKESRKENSSEDKMTMDSAESGSLENSTINSPNESNDAQQVKSEKMNVQNKMVIYEANLSIRVKHFEQTVRTIEQKAAQYGGYTAESTVSREGKEQLGGYLTIRIPQKYFQDFLHDAEGQAVEVFERNLTGQDVTEEYVDLESRLKSKRVVEERLLSFMKGASKTEDLLKISADLASIQEEIETLQGKMKYLENQTSFSTVRITLYEKKVVIPDIEKEELNTWEKTKKQFMKSTNLLLSFLSGLVVFLLGNLPILGIFIMIGLVGLITYKNRKKRDRQE